MSEGSGAVKSVCIFVAIDFFLLEALYNPCTYAFFKSGPAEICYHSRNAIDLMSTPGTGDAL